MTDHTTGKRKLQQALKEYIHESYASSLEEMTPCHPTIKIPPKPVRLHYFHSAIKTFVRHAAAFFLCGALIAAAIVTIEASSGTRPEFMWENGNNTIFVYYKDSDADRSPEIFKPLYDVGYVPAGYVLLHELLDEERYEKTYINVNGYVIKIVQQEFDQTISIEKSTLEPTVFYRNNRRILFCQEEMRTICVWNNDEYVFTLTVYGKIQEKTIYRILSAYENASKSPS